MGSNGSSDQFTPVAWGHLIITLPETNIAPTFLVAWTIFRVELLASGVVIMIITNMVGLSGL